MSNLRPVSNYLMLESIEEDLNPGGLIAIPETSKHRNYHIGRILECGPDVLLECLAGDQVVHQTHAEFVVQRPNNPTLLFIRDTDVIAVLEKDKILPDFKSIFEDKFKDT